MALKSGTAVCRLDDIDDGAACVVVLGPWRNGHEIIVARQGHAVYGYINICAHAELPLNIDRNIRTAAGLLICDHHGAAFRFADGRCVKGVCESLSLVPVALVVRDGDVVLC